MTFEAALPHIIAVIQIIALLAAARLFRRGFHAEGRMKAGYYSASIVCTFIAASLMPRLDWYGVIIVTLSLVAMVTVVMLIVNRVFAGQQ